MWTSSVFHLYFEQKGTVFNSICSQDFLMLSVPFAQTELGRKAFVHSIPSSWKTLQKAWKLTDLIPLSVFKSKLKFLETDVLNLF